MAGSIRKRAWTTRKGEAKTAWVADYTDQAGRRRNRNFATRKEAAAWLVQAQHEVVRGVHTPASTSITIAEAGELWLAQGKADGLEASTLMQYRQHLDLHIKPFIGRVKLGELAPAGVQSFRNGLLEEGRSRAMAKRAIASLGSILAVAMAVGRVGRNVVRDQARTNRREARLDQRHKRHLEVGVDIPSKDEIRAMLAAAQGRWRALLVTAVFTGLRASELRGLRWGDVDLDEAVLTVRQRADRWNVIGSPKSAAGKREVPLAPIVVNALREWWLACPAGEIGLVFPNTKGAVDSLPNMHRRGLGVVQVLAGLSKEAAHPKYGLHALRHTAASLYIEEGLSPKRVQVLMGHSSIQVTFDTYGHLFPSPQDDRATMRRLQARLLEGAA
jgi:integrase